MTNIIDLASYRARKQKQWLASYEKKLDSYICNWLCLRTNLDFIQVANSYQALQCSYSEDSWDYLDLRDLIQEVMEDISIQLYEDLKKEYWFESSLLSKQKIIEYSMSLYIMNSLKIGS